MSDFHLQARDHRHDSEELNLDSVLAVPRSHWTSLAELDGSAEIERLRREEFLEKPVGYFDAAGWKLEDVNRRPGPIMEATGFLELAVKNNESANTDGFSRRDFLKLSGAAIAFATAGCGLRPAEKIVPYVKAPEGLVPGVANYYASSLGDAQGTSVLVKTREGRPIKLEGNPDHPLTQGKLGVAGQAAIFGLYDPDRLRGPVKLTRGKEPVPAMLTWSTADDEMARALNEAQGKIVLLTGTVHGPARTKLIEEFLAGFPGARHVTFDGWSHQGTRNAQEKCYGARALPHYRWDRAEFVLLLDNDALGSGYASLEWQVGYGGQRRVRHGKYLKLVAFEPCLTLTGSNADERYPVRAGDAVHIGLAIARELLEKDGSDAAEIRRSEARAALSKYPAPDVEGACNLPKGTIKRLAAELWKHRGESIVMGADDETTQVIVSLINALLGNDGKTVDAVNSPSQQSLGSVTEMQALINDMKSGAVNTLIIWGTNPNFTLPVAAGFADASKRVKHIVALTDRVDETAYLADYVLPTLHPLESWSDAEPVSGMLSLQQPAILPLYDNRSGEQSLLSFAQTAKAGALGAFVGDWRQYMMAAWEQRVYAGGGFEAPFALFWNGVLRDGVLNRTTEKTQGPREFRVDALNGLSFPTVDRNNLELYIYPSPNLGDGRDANNAWLLELPDPVSKLSWTNCASISEATATKLGVKSGDLVLVEAGGEAIELPVNVQVGDADGVVSVQSGWGRRHAGRVAEHTGGDAFKLRQFKGGALLSSGIVCSVKPTGESVRMPNTQGHNYIEGRHIVYETTFDEYLKDPKSGQHGHHETGSLWGEGYKYEGYRWGMAIDLSSCIGCNACVIACSVENNIPVVGRTQIVKGREMHWIRIDRYYSGDRANPEVTFQPMLCQQCENAPCETVCPVLATVHDDEGINQQVYNRCVGTRYCSNNCPYKVRRFNWHEYTFQAYDERPLELALNPDVTVREKGVMEKCTFCHQRVREGKGKAKQMNRKVIDSDILTACQQTCPTGAITFGDMNNPESAVSVARQDPRGFLVLEELNVRPSITYYTKLRHRAQRPGEGLDHGHDGYTKTPKAHA